MATNLMAQDVIRCDLCDGKPVPSPSDVVCNTCKINLCNECLPKHVSFDLSIKHDIGGVGFKTNEIPSVLCQLHSNLKCDLHCTNCHTPLCPKCISSGSHKHHDVIEILAIFDSQKQIIQKDTEELENLIAPVYENMNLELQNRVSKLPEGYGSFRQSIVQQGKEWHDAVDIVIKINLAKAEQMEKDDLALLRNLQSEMNDQLSKVRKIIQDNQNLLKSNDNTEIMNYKPRNDEFRGVPPSFELSLPCFVPRKIQLEELSQTFGEMKLSVKTDVKGYTIPEQEKSSPSVKKFLNKPSFVRNIDADLFANYVCCVPNTEQCCIKQRGTIRRIDNKGTEHERVTTKSGNSTMIWMTVSKKGNLVYTDYDDKSINMVHHGNIDTIIRFHDWRPKGVCSTSSDDLLVCMVHHKKEKSKVVRYTGSTLTQEIQFDENEKPLYSFPSFIEENKNFQVCVSDDKKVVVTDKNGKLHFTYNGKFSLKKFKAFDPHGLATDSMCNILVTDFDNRCVHIISHEGKFIRYIDSFELYHPSGLSVSSDGILYIADCTNKVKMIKYLQ